MDKKFTYSAKKVLPTLALTLFIIVLTGLAFLPAVRNGNTDVAAGAREVGDVAAETLYGCMEYARTNRFTAKLSGTAKARAVGVPYTLSVRGERKVDGSEFEAVKEGVSAIAKVGLKTSCINGVYYVTRGEFDKAANGFAYPEPEKTSLESYIETFGATPVGLLRYDVDGNILSAERIDENVFRYVLNVAAAETCKREVGALMNGKNPEYKSIELTLTTDGERAVKVSAVEKFRVDKFGSVNCTVVYDEVFIYDK